MVKKEPVKQLPKCYGNPEAECVATCALEPACANHWLFQHSTKDPEEREKQLEKAFEGVQQEAYNEGYDDAEEGNKRKYP